MAITDNWNTEAVILTSAIVTTGSTFGASVLPESVGGQGGLPHPRLIFGTAFTFIGLSILGQFAPEVAGPLALAIAVTAMTYYGMPLLDNAFNGAKNPVGRKPQ